MTTGSDSLFAKIYEWLIYIAIIVTPINNTLNYYGYYAVVTYTTVVLLMVGFICNLSRTKAHRATGYASLLIVVVLVLELILQTEVRRYIDIQWILTIMVFCLYTTLPGSFSTKRIYSAFYIATIISAICSISFGQIEGELTRTATLVDGSIAVITMAILLFAEENCSLTRNYRILKAIAFPSCIIIAGFGMSRIRVILLLGLFLVKALLFSMQAIKTGTVRNSAVILTPLIILVLYLVWQLDITQRVAAAVEARFVNGFEDPVRDAEIEAGMIAFRNNRILGKGWGKFYYRAGEYKRIYYNHCMYVAILARGGLLMASAFVNTFFRLVRDVFHRKNQLCWALLIVFLGLAYGNAGVFNYTINTMFIPLIVNLKQNQNDLTQLEVK